MSFNIDNQSYKDLNIFTNDPIFNMFKGTRTLGARDMLNAMMQNPSSVDIIKNASIKKFKNSSSP